MTARGFLSRLLSQKVLIAEGRCAREIFLLLDTVVYINFINGLDG
jgi:hypothetical protein